MRYMDATIQAEVNMLKKLFVITLIMAAMFIACNDKPTTAPIGYFSLYFQDGMAAYDSVFVGIDTIYIKTASNPDYWNPFEAGTTSVDIARYRNGRRALMDQRVLAPGTIVTGIWA